MVDPIRTISVGELEANVFPDLDATGFAAAAAAADVLIQTIARKGGARMVIAGGNAQLVFIRALSSFDRIPWAKVVVFQAREYAGLEEGHPASIAEWIQVRVEKAFRPGAVHYLSGSAKRSEAECRRFAKLLGEAPIDLACLGIGENGRIAFNDPGSDFQESEAVKEVELGFASRKQQALEGHFADIHATPTHGLTLTVPTLMAAEALHVTVTGERKSEAVRRALRGKISPECPASVLRTRANVKLFLDADAAAHVDREL